MDVFRRSFTIDLLILFSDIVEKCLTENPHITLTNKFPQRFLVFKVFSLYQHKKISSILQTDYFQ
jgi:hypothetical protein